MKERKKPTGRPNRSRPEILAALELVGDMTSTEITNLTGINIRTVQLNMRKLIDEKVVHIARWEKGARYELIAVYRLGPGRSVPRPPAKSEHERYLAHLAYKRRRRARERIKGRLKRRASFGELNVFSAMVVQLGEANGKMG